LSGKKPRLVLNFSCSNPIEAGGVIPSA